MYLGPLTFKEVFKTKPWGGRALARLCGKKLPPGEPIGESWEVADHPNGMSVVAEGLQTGRTLRELVQRHCNSLLGRDGSQKRFPLLLKLLDARAPLSVQVHPDDECARAMKLNDPGKTEAWYVIESRRNGRIIAGFKSRRVLSRLRQAAADGTLGDTLQSISPKAGETWLCRAGTVHALGPGVVLLEVQQNSDSTFRLYDWGRVGLDGKPRQLHIEDSFRAINGRALTLRAARPERLRDIPFPAERLVKCEKFVIDRWRVGSSAMRSKAKVFEILHIISGTGTLTDARGQKVRLRRGRTVLIPACVSRYTIMPWRPLAIVRIAE